MEIYIDKCLSLPEQVQKNKCDIENINENLDLTKWNHETVNLLSTGWGQSLGSNVTYDIVNSKFIENMVFAVVPCDENDSNVFGDIYFAESYDGGVVLTSRYKPSVDIDVIIYYNYNVSD